LRVTDAIDLYRKQRSEAGLDSIEIEFGHDHVDWLTYGQYARAQGKLAR
jgi:hypothetical protein